MDVQVMARSALVWNPSQHITYGARGPKFSTLRRVRYQLSRPCGYSANARRHALADNSRFDTRDKTENKTQDAQRSDETKRDLALRKTIDPAIRFRCQRTFI